MKINNYSQNIFSHIKKWFVMHRTIIILACTVLIGGFLRLHNFTDLLRFNNDQVRDAKIVHAMIADNAYPLLGPKAGGTTFKLGPAFYYMEYISAGIFGDTPQGIALFVPILGTLSIILFYIFVKKYFMSSVALLLTFLYATSFYAIKYARFAWNPNVIPFFLLLFILLLLKTLADESKNTFLWFCLLGITTGIAMQLHTTLFVLLPIIIIITHGLRYVRSKKISLLHLAITGSIAFALLLPMAIYDFHSRGENIAAFFHGSDTKTAKQKSLTKNLLLDGQFFIQSATYIISGIEPTKNWTNPKKIALTKNYKEITIAFVSTLLFLICIFLFIQHARNTKTDTETKNLHTLVLSITVASFLLFLPIAHELNTRFFIVLIFLPFILIGFFFEKLISTTQLSQKMRIFIVSMLTSVIFAVNMHTYVTAYNHTATTTNSNIYGGVSMQELSALTDYMHTYAQSDAEKMYLIPHAFGQSIRYIAQQKNMSLSSTAANNVPLGKSAFFLSEKIHDTTLPDKLSSCFTVDDTQKILRFRIFTLRKTAAECN